MGLVWRDPPATFEFPHVSGTVGPTLGLPHRPTPCSHARPDFLWACWHSVPRYSGWHPLSTNRMA
eukprot:10938018-Heterocapsa_arctica.AAC.1